MATLTEVSEFIDEVLRLDLDTPVMGYNGTEIGPANEQAQVLANRTKWLKEEIDKLNTALKELGDKEYVISINRKTGNVLLTYTDVGAAAVEHTHSPSEIKTDDNAQFVSTEEKTKWNSKQDKLISSETLKTVAGYTLLGEGNVIIKSSDIIVTSDGRFVTDAEKALWSGKQDVLVSGSNIKSLHGNSLTGSGDVKLTYKNVGADKEGTASNAIINHCADIDPHSQYLTEERGDSRYITLSTANQPDGYLQLDSTGSIPAELGKLYQARYVTVDHKAERLALDMIGDITICLQADENRVYYLNPSLDPKEESNWKAGESTDVGSIVSVFGRNGIITAQAGDYNTNQITETDEKTFVSSSDRINWYAKQNKLVSGVNIKTVNNESLLGSTDIEITPASIGAAETGHTHNPSDIVTTEDKGFVSSSEKKIWNNKQDTLVSGTSIKTLNSNTLLGNGNIEITYSEVGAAKAEHTHSPSEIETTEDEEFVSSAEKKIWNAKQDKLENGVTLKTISGTSLLGSGNIIIDAADINIDSQHQFVTDSDRIKWDNKQDTLVSGTNIKKLNNYSLLGSNTLNLTANDVGADKEGTAATKIDNHVKEVDPHPNYLNVSRGNELFVVKTTANQPNGYLQLDKNGYIPAELSELFQSRYVTVDHKAERLALDMIGDITICLQADENRVYYLNPLLDPKEESNWKAGRDVTSGTVISVFGRAGIIDAEPGDYNTNQITETDEKTFVSNNDRSAWDAKQDTLVSGTSIKTVNKSTLLGSGDIEITPAGIGAAETEHTHSPSDVETDSNAQFVSVEEKNTWSAKQDALTSGTTIKTVNKSTLLGSGDIEITPASIGAAETEHTHSPSDVETDSSAQFVSLSEKTKWNSKQDKLTSGTTLSTVFGKDLLSGNNVTIEDADTLPEVMSKILTAGEGTTIDYNDTNKLITIGRSKEDIERDNFTIIEMNDVIGGRGYRYRLDGLSINSYIKVLKKAPVFEKRTEIINYDNPDIPLIVNELPENDALGYYPNGKPDVNVTLASVAYSVEKYMSGAINENTVASDTEALTVICENTLENVIPSFTSANTTNGFTPFANSTYGGFYPWKAFQDQLEEDEKEPVGNNNAWSAYEYWTARPDETYLGIKNTTLVKATGYGLQNFTSFYWGKNSSSPTAWDFQGRNEDTDEWTTLDSQTNQNIMNGKEGWTTYRLDKAYFFKQFRLLINEVDGTTRATIPRFAICNDVGMLVKDKNGRYLTPDEYGDYKVVSVTDTNSFRTYCFNTPAKPLVMSLFKEIAPIKICTLKDIPVTIKQCKIVPAIAIQYPLYPQTFWDGLSDINPTVYYSDNANKEVKFAATINGMDYYVYGETEWVSLGQLTNDDNSANTLLTKGMDGDDFFNITDEQWAALLATSDEPSVGVAFARNIVAKDMSITPKVIEATFNEINGYEVMSFDKVTIKIADSFIIVNPVDDGDYRFCYKLK